MTEQTDWTDSHGWHYEKSPPENGDCRKLVWLEQDGMAWIGIRAWHREGRWYNGNEPERADVLCWQDLPQCALRHWDRGRLSPESPRAKLLGRR